MVIKVKPGTPNKMDSTDARTFEQWMEAVDRVCWLALGLSVHDLPDCLFRDWYDDRVRPVRAAQRAAHNAGAME